MFVRTITTFAVLTPNQSEWETSLQRAENHNQQCKLLLEKHGFSVQTTRIITNPYPEYTNITNKETFLKDIEYLKSFVSENTRFNIGACTSKQYKDTLAYLPEAILKYNISASCLVPETSDGIVDMELCYATAETIRTIADTTPGGEGNFNFCGSGSPVRPSTTNTWNPAGGSMVGVPYFPSGYTTTEEGWYCTIGLQFPDIIVEALQPLCNNTSNTSSSSIVNTFASRTEDWEKGGQAIKHKLSYYMSNIATIVNSVCQETNIPVRGIDGSIAPLPTAASVVDIYKLFGLSYYGAPGTLEISSYLTKILKSVPVYILPNVTTSEIDYQEILDDTNSIKTVVPLIGYSGLMLPPTEDTGLAAAHTNNQYTIRDLLMYSAVCGIGLDTVPVPGDTSVLTITNLLADVMTLSYRLCKPLSVRLFPVPGLNASELTKFENPNLCNTRVFHI